MENADGASRRRSRGEEFWEDQQDIVKSLGLVFGDIGTSPIYTLTVIFLLLKPTVDN
ncbi:MAG: KUP/HAK/KT family potassium transporter, partial [Syntrophorhabdus sp.]